MVFFGRFNFGKQGVVGLSSPDSRLSGLRPEPQKPKALATLGFPRPVVRLWLAPKTTIPKPKTNTKTKT